MLLLEAWAILQSLMRRYDLHVLLVEHGKRCPRCSKTGHPRKEVHGPCPLVNLAEAANETGDWPRARTQLVELRKRAGIDPGADNLYGLPASPSQDEARELIREHRGSLTIGLVLMLINRLSGMVLPYSSKYLIDDVIGKHRADLLMPLAAVAAAATLIQAATRRRFSITLAGSSSDPVPVLRPR